MNAKEEAAYMQGRRAVTSRLFSQLLGELGYKEEDLKSARLISEREEAVAVLRSLCAEFGDNDWPDNLHLADIIDKHLGRHLHKA